MKAFASLTIVVALEACFCSFGMAAENENSPPALKPLVVMSAADSHMSKPAYGRITTPETWTRVWVRHLGTTSDNYHRPRLEVDFDRCLVVAIFRGNANAASIQVDSLTETAESIVIRFNESTYQTDGAADIYATPDRPYAFIVLPKTSKPIVLEENVQQYLGHPPVWKECARLEVNRTAGAQEVKAR